MNIFKFTQQETDYNFNSKNISLKDNVKKKLLNILMQEDNIKTFNLQCKNIAFLFHSSNYNDVNDLNYHFDKYVNQIINVKKYNLFSYKFPKSSTLMPYGGSKRNHRRRNNYISNHILSFNSIDTIFEPFIGAGSLLFDNLYLYKKYNIKEITINDLNKAITTMFINIRDNKENVIKELTNIAFDLKVKFKTFNFDNNKMLDDIEEIYPKKLNELTMNNIFNEKTTALFLFCQHLSVNGMIDYSINTKELKYKFGKDSGKFSIKKVFLIINKVEFYSKALNILKINILNDDYNNIIEKYKKKNVYLVVDSPYADLEKLELISGGYNYSTEKDSNSNFGNSFNQQELLNHLSEHSLSGGSFMYWNNHHSKIELYSNDTPITYKKINIKYAVRKEETKEIVMYSNPISAFELEEKILYDCVLHLENEEQYINEYEEFIDESDKQEYYYYLNKLNNICKFYEESRVKIPEFALKYKYKNFNNSVNENIMREMDEVRRLIKKD